MAAKSAPCGGCIDKIARPELEAVFIVKPCAFEVAKTNLYQVG